MARRRRAEKREIRPDPKFGSVELAKFINRVMLNGKQTVAQRIVYSAIDKAEEEAHRPGLEVFKQAVNNVTPALEVRSRRVGGATYQVPREVRFERQLALAMRWIITSARARSGRPMAGPGPGDPGSLQGTGNRGKTKGGSAPNGRGQSSVCPLQMVR